MARTFKQNKQQWFQQTHMFETVPRQLLISINPKVCSLKEKVIKCETQNLL